MIWEHVRSFSGVSSRCLYEGRVVFYEILNKKTVIIVARQGRSQTQHTGTRTLHTQRVDGARCCDDGSRPQLSQAHYRNIALHPPLAGSKFL